MTEITGEKKGNSFYFRLAHQDSLSEKTFKVRREEYDHLEEEQS